MQRQTIDRPFEVKEVNKDGTFVGYASVFGELDSYRDIVMPGAFTKSLAKFAERKRRVPMLWQHSSRQPIGGYPELKEDGYGLLVKGECNMKVQQGVEAHALMEKGDLSGLSIGYDTITEEWDQVGLSRKLHEVELWEISPVTFPAGDSARVLSVKQIEGIVTLADAEGILRDAGFSKAEALALVAKIKGAASRSESEDGDQLKRLQQAISNLNFR